MNIQTRAVDYVKANCCIPIVLHQQVDGRREGEHKYVNKILVSSVAVTVGCVNNFVILLLE